MKKLLIIAALITGSFSTTSLAAGRSAYECLNIDSPNINKFYDKATKSVDLEAFYEAQEDWLETNLERLSVIQENLKLVIDEYGGTVSVDQALEIECNVSAEEFAIAQTTISPVLMPELDIEIYRNAKAAPLPEQTKKEYSKALKAIRHMGNYLEKLDLNNLRKLNNVYGEKGEGYLDTTQSYVSVMQQACSSAKANGDSDADEACNIYAHGELTLQRGRALLSAIIKVRKRNIFDETISDVPSLLALDLDTENPHSDAAQGQVASTLKKLQEAMENENKLKELVKKKDDVISGLVFDVERLTNECKNGYEKVGRHKLTLDAYTNAAACEWALIAIKVHGPVEKYLEHQAKLLEGKLGDTKFTDSAEGTRKFYFGFD